MREAIRLARKGFGRTSPNPVVGAVVVLDDNIVGKGYHQYAGGPHAEVHAIRDAGEKTQNATIYVTLEPCNHQGRTPPCTMAILQAGITRVVVGLPDPNPNVKGGGAAFLQRHGIRVDSGIMEAECRDLNQPFIKYSTTGLPFVTLKAAATLDGRIASRTGDSRWISNEQSRHFVHLLRTASDGILVGIDTVLADDPQLTARLKGNKTRRQPTRIVLDSRLRLPTDSKLATSAREVPVLLACGENASADRESELAARGIQIARFPLTDNRVDLHALLEELGKRQITTLLVEGGARVLGAFIEGRMADSFHFFYAPKILGDCEALPMIRGNRRDCMSEALHTFAMSVKLFGDDVMLSGRFNEHPY